MAILKVQEPSPYLIIEFDFSQEELGRSEGLSPRQVFRKSLHKRFDKKLLLSSVPSDDQPTHFT